MELPRRRRAATAHTPSLRPIPAWRWTIAAVVLFAVSAVGVTLWLLTIAGHAAPGTDLANARLDAVRTGLAAGAGAGAAVGFILAFRRQHHQEVATVLTDRDATERRITELYSKAVEQLGSDKAPVRLGGLYALERLAQDNPSHRQTIVNVICAYLRMPFPPTPPGSDPSTDPDDPTAGVATTASAESSSSWQQEKQVRLTAQRLLGDHLRRTPAKQDGGTGRFWSRTGPVSLDDVDLSIDLDLTGATLIDFELPLTVLGVADFDGATFIGRASFMGATFTGWARFSRTIFTSEARFTGATFFGTAWFDKATFAGKGAIGTAWFDNVDFAGGGATGASFLKATFTSEARFTGATFSGTAWFDKATFSSLAHFDDVTFNLGSHFKEATFDNVARFVRATFDGTAFTDATFASDAQFDQATFIGRAWFNNAIFDGNPPSFTGSRVLEPDADDLWPTGWQVHDNGVGERTVAQIAAAAPEG